MGTPFDPYPFSLLGVIVAVEAVILSRTKHTPANFCCTFNVFSVKSPRLRRIGKDSHETFLHHPHRHGFVRRKRVCPDKIAFSRNLGVGPNPEQIESGYRSSNP